MIPQDHPSSDSFYDSDAADGEVPMEKVERDEVEQQIDGETAEVDGEWGRQTNLFVMCTLFNKNKALLQRRDQEIFYCLAELLSGN